MELTIVCWLWKGWNPIYGADDVHRLQRKLQKHMSVPFRFVCITDTPEGLECETFPLWSFPDIDQEKRREVLREFRVRKSESRRIKIDKMSETPLPDCFKRLRLFDPEINRHFGDYVVSIDLDCEVFGDLWPLFEGGETFRIARGGGRAKYCGSMWMLKTGEHEDVWQDFEPDKIADILQKTEHDNTPIVGSDQAWLSLKFDDAPVWADEEGVYFLRPLGAHSTHRLQRPGNCRIVFAAGRIKMRDPDCRLFVPWLHKAACLP